jgi:hypothetical protein
MHKYKFCNFSFESDLPFPELEPAGGPEPELRVTVTRTTVSDESHGEWFHTWSLQDETPWLLLGRQPSGYFLRFPGMADFAVLDDAREVRGYTVEDTPPETIRHLILDQVLPLLLSHHGRFVLHGSAIATPRGAIGFLGQTGWGKSTLASSFSEEGMAVLTDDCLLLEEKTDCMTVIPSYPGVRLWPDSAQTVAGEDKCWAEVAHYTGKKRLDANAGIGFCGWPTELRRLYFLSSPNECTSVSVNPLSPREVMLELVKYSYLMDVTSRLRLQQDFERLAKFAVNPIFFRLAFPHDYSQLATVRQAILSDLQLSE